MPVSDTVRLDVEVDPLGAAGGPGTEPGGVDVDTAHVGEVDHEAAFAHALAAEVVAATLDRHQQAVFAGEVDAGLHVGRAGTPADDGRLVVDHPVPDPAGVLVPVGLGREERAPHPPRKCLERLALHSGLGTIGRQGHDTRHVLPPCVPEVRV
jgi:hypothetical protein